MIESVIEFEVNGKKRGFRNDHYALLIACRKDGGGLSDLLERVEQKDTLAFMNLLYGLSVSWCESKGRPVDFIINDMHEWINHVGADQMAEYVKQLFKSPEPPKNSKSPQETGIAVTA
jgi:hypothetical protein